MPTRRSGLGRGLSALIPSGESNTAPASVEETTEVLDLRDRTFREVPVGSITANTFQPRKQIDDKELQPLADSIKELGVLQPLLVRPIDDTHYELIAGERRWRASKKAGLKNVPVIVKTTEDIDSLEQALVENLHRKDLNPLDEASAYRQLIDDFSMSHDAVAQRMGKSRASVTNLLRLLQLQPKVQRLLIDEKLSEGHARALLGTDDEAFQLQLAERVARDGMTVRGVEDAVRLRTELAKPSTKKRPTKALKGNKEDAAVLEWQERLTEYLDTRVNISSAGRNGKIVIDFADLDDLDRVAGLIEGYPEEDE